VEASPQLRNQQAKLLSDVDELDANTRTARSKILSNVDINWVERVNDLPHDQSTMPFMIAHEFFDALPIHVFQNAPKTSASKPSDKRYGTMPQHPHGSKEASFEWHELLVNTKPPQTTLTASTSSSHAKNSQDEFHLTLSATPTPHSLLLPQESSRYEALSKMPNAVIEISPESLDAVSEMAARIGGSPGYPKPVAKGAALILDYGPKDTIPANSLRGIRDHRPVSPFSSPGLVDLSADVDFAALAEGALEASSQVEVHGPVEQAFFLETMGIRERAQKLIEGARNKGDQREVEEMVRRLEGSWKRLVDRGPQGMGKLYKALAIVPYNERGPRRPVGFGGNVV
jgi:NADH dehydrogenase [ubiquinone] 1 alpha subcomplex assembly factor 7